jgi:hypothetical protein
MAVLQSPNGPAITSIANSQVAIAFRGMNSFLNVVIAGAGSGTFGNLYTSPSESCIYSPAIAYMSAGGARRLFMAWKGSTNDDISLAELSLSGDESSVITLTKKGGTLFNVAARGPALVLIGSELWMAYTASDFTVRYLSYGDLAGGRDPVAGAIQQVPGALSYGNPTLCSTDGRGLFVAWTDAGGALNVYSVNHTGFIWNTGAAKNQNTMTLPGQGSNDGVSLAYITDRMYLAWSDGANQVRLLREDHWQSPAGNVQLVPLTSPAAPAVTRAQLPDGSLNLNIVATAIGSYNLGLTQQPK